jgi:hypothetical protein
MPDLAREKTKVRTKGGWDKKNRFPPVRQCAKLADMEMVLLPSKLVWRVMKKKAR